MTTKVWIPTAPVGYTSTSTNAQQAAWIEDFRQSLIDVGLVQTADSGQFTTGTYSTVAAGTNNAASSFDVDAYLIYRFNDTLQATAPIFIKIEICKGVGAAAVGYLPVLRVTVGTGSDGVGNITGPTAQIRNNNGSTSGAYFLVSAQSWASYSTTKGFFGVVFNPTNFVNSGTQYGCLSFFVERIPDSNGAPTNQGFTLWRNSTAAPAAPGTDYSSNDSLDGTTVMTPSGATYSSGKTSIPYFASMSFYPVDQFVIPAYHLTPAPVRANGIVMMKKGVLTRGSEIDAINYGVTTSHYVVMDEYTTLRPNPVNTEGVIAFLFE